MKHEDQGGADLHRQEQEFQRPAPQNAVAYPVLGENLEGLHELECRRSAPKPQLLNPVLGENLEDLPDFDDDEELECQRSAPQAATTRNWNVDDLLGSVLLEQG